MDIFTVEWYNGQMLKRFWSAFCKFWSESWEETGRAAVASSMWVEGYTDDEIAREIRRMYG
jgi:hypothetical protein